MYHVIFNPVAGKKKATKNLQVVERVLAERSVAYELHKSRDVHDAEHITRKLCEKGEKEFIVLGGDGTLNEVLNGLINPKECKIGLIPSGTGNDFAEKIGIPLDVEQAILKILDGEAKPVDYIEVSGTRSMNVAGLGIDVDVLERCNKGKMRGKLKYIFSLLKSLFAFKGIRVEIEKENGETQTREVLLCAVCNGAQFGGGIQICPPADPADGKLDVVLVDCIGGVWKIIKACIQLMKRKVIEYPLTTYFQCERVRFITENPCPIQLDGEVYQNHDFEAKIGRGLGFYY